MRLVFIAGPFRGATNWEIQQNVRRAESLALEVWRLGAAALCPHTNTANFQDAAPDDIWLAGGLEMLRRCDAVMLVKGWLESTGTLAEIEEARRIGIPVFDSIEKLGNWIKK